MGRSVEKLVVDASVVIKWFIHEKGTDSALSLAESAAVGEIDLCVPDICFAECANVIWRLVAKQSVLTESQGELAASQLAELPLAAVPCRDLIATAYRMAIEKGITVYDGLYVALACAHDATLITADRRLCRKLADTPYAPLIQAL
jgi:predicted nucleic acid-binding protein